MPETVRLTQPELLLEASLDAAIKALEEPPVMHRNHVARIAGRVAQLRELCDRYLVSDDE